MNAPAPALSAPAPALTSKRRRKALGLLGFALVALTGISIVLYAWQLPPFTSTIESTENAYVRGQTTLISSQVGGYVWEVPVMDFQHVGRGDLLATIDDRIYRQQLDQAKAQRQTAQSNLSNWTQQQRGAEANIAQVRANITSNAAQRDKAHATLRRAGQLIDERLISEQDYDTAYASDAQANASLSQSQANLRMAEQQLRSVEVNRTSLEAAVASAEAAVKLAQINLDNTRIHAPRSGQLGQIAVRQGAYVTIGTQLMAIVPETKWIIANFKETQLKNIRIGQPANFTVDALGGARLHGKVEEISPATGSEFSILPPDNATGNFVKVVQRIPVKIRIDPDQRLAARLSPGMSVVVNIDTADPKNETGAE
ncbi:MAG: HlyD family secretion protein [Xanthomonadaceae bacterium]|jgi:multidrug resistance efflux pump|nr:HlyD family secretion protein [Xanthomonadaceae bacterium]